MHTEDDAAARASSCTRHFLVAPRNKVKERGCAPYQLAPRVCQSFLKHSLLAGTSRGGASSLLGGVHVYEVCIQTASCRFRVHHKNGHHKLCILADTNLKPCQFWRLRQCSIPHRDFLSGHRLFRWRRARRWIIPPGAGQFRAFPELPIIFLRTQGSTWYREQLQAMSV